MTVQDIASQLDITYFPKLMKYLRVRQNISARTLSKRAGLSASYVSKMERGDLVPTLEAFAAIVKNLDCSDSEIVCLVALCSRV